MHKSFYASGFLHHSPSQQILLQQLIRGDITNFVLFRGKSKNGEDPKTVFKHSVEKALGIAVPSASIQTVYDYIHTNLGMHFIFYVEMKDVGNQNGWLPLSKLSKFPMSQQTRHDIIVGERVIRSLLEASLPPVKKRNYLQT